MALKRFQDSSGNKDQAFIFLLSTRAGGVGINLTEADTVIFYDSDFNPHADSQGTLFFIFNSYFQALHRVYRIGQKKPVLILRLLCANTVEELVYQRSLKKLSLSSTILSEGAFFGKIIPSPQSDLEDDETKCNFFVNSSLCSKCFNFG